MNTIYTKTGDTGQTSLREGVRVDKDDLRIEVNGQIDHLNALLGMVRTVALSDDEKTLLRRIQCEFMVVMSLVATPDGSTNPRPLHLAELTAEMEHAIDRLTAGKTLGFTIPGDNAERAVVHVARTQTRTVERRLWTLHRQHPLPTDVLTFFNRLSDYLFVLTL
ncbi:MAG: cob(I)yrinic acid a,c-diamide adenosyltransferase [Bacteroidaceae bacterium]|nr:cob(I)yrinic acid a,c-diamide adenosyltransferase [Bacteroidaceae bacterium]